MTTLRSWSRAIKGSRTVSMMLSEYSRDFFAVLFHNIFCLLCCRRLPENLGNVYGSVFLKESSEVLGTVAFLNVVCFCFNGISYRAGGSGRGGFWAPGTDVRSGEWPKATRAWGMLTVMGHSRHSFLWPLFSQPRPTFHVSYGVGFTNGIGV